MKKIAYLIFIIFFMGVNACVNSGKDEKSTKKEAVQSNSDCDEFLAHYEEWIDEYLKIVSDYFENPADEELAARYMEVVEEATEWSSKWVTLADCAENEAYKKKFEDLSKDLEEKLKELKL